MALVDVTSFRTLTIAFVETAYPLLLLFAVAACVDALPEWLSLRPLRAAVEPARLTTAREPTGPLS